MAQTLIDFKDIQDAVLEELKIPSSDTTALNRIKRDINIVYLNEVCAKKNWTWLRKNIRKVLPKVYTTGTASVTNGSTTVTLSTNTPVSVGSLANYYFSVGNNPEVYGISAHTSNSDTLTLDIEFVGDTNSEASFKIWTDRIALPTDCRATYQITNPHQPRPLTGIGKQKFNRIKLRDPEFNDYPYYYTTDDYFDPSSGDAESETDRYRVTRVYPAVNTKDALLEIEYIQEADELDNDGDEPFMPLEDRVIILYGALKKAWLRERNVEQAQINELAFKEKFQEMEAKIDDSMDFPTIAPDNDYLSLKRNASTFAYKWIKD